MKILAISHLFPYQKETRYGIFVKRQLEAIAQHGVEVTVVVPRIYCPRFLSRFKRWEKYDKESSLIKSDLLKIQQSHYIRLPGEWFIRWAGLSAYWSMKHSVFKMHMKDPYDIIYANDFFPDCDIAMRLKKLLNVPAVGVSIGIDVNKTAKSSQGLTRHFCRIASFMDGIITRGKGVANEVRLLTGRDSFCIYGVVDLEIFKPAKDKKLCKKDLGLPVDKKVIIYTGYIDRRKGITELLQAFYRLTKTSKDVCLVLCGSGEMDMWVEDFVKSKHIEAMVFQAGQVPPTQIHRWLKASDVFVLPSYSEGMPNGVMEAMACGLPIVATAVGGIPDALKNCLGVVLVPPKDETALKGSMEKMLNMSSRDIISMITSVRQKAEKDFGALQNADKILQYLTGITKGYQS